MIDVGLDSYPPTVRARDRLGHFSETAVAFDVARSSANEIETWVWRGRIFRGPEEERAVRIRFDLIRSGGPIALLLEFTNAPGVIRQNATNPLGDVEIRATREDGVEVLKQRLLPPSPTISLGEGETYGVLHPIYLDENTSIAPWTPKKGRYTITVSFEGVEIGRREIEVVEAP